MLRELKPFVNWCWILHKQTVGLKTFSSVFSICARCTFNQLSFPWNVLCCQTSVIIPGKSNNSISNENFFFFSYLESKNLQLLCELWNYWLWPFSDSSWWYLLMTVLVTVVNATKVIIACKEQFLLFHHHTIGVKVYTWMCCNPQPNISIFE